jgi:malate dehydrogenase
MSKVTIIGAGQVGGLSALRIAESGLADIVLLDVAKGIAVGKAMDIEDGSRIIGHDKLIKASDDFSLMEGSEIVVITAGFSRKPGMSREDLLNKNAQVLRGIVAHIKDLKKKPIVIIVTNPVDILTYLVLKLTGLDKRRVIGLGVSLDTARFINLIRQELKVNCSDIDALVVGTHSEKMIPLVRLVKVKGKPLNEILSQEKIKSLVEATQQRGAAIVANLGSGSAFFAPSAAILEMVKAILLDERRETTASVYLDGEYNLKDICFGVPVIIGKNGIEDIFKIELTKEESEEFINTARGVKECLIYA